MLRIIVSVLRHDDVPPGAYHALEVRMANKGEFAYEFQDDALKVQWSIVRNGAMKLGDTLLCRRA